MVHYARQVKEMYWPKVSKKKQLEIEQLREGFRANPARHSAVDIVKNIKSPGNLLNEGLLSDNDDLGHRSGPMTELGSAQNKNLHRNYSQKKHPDWKKLKNTMKPDSKE